MFIGERERLNLVTMILHYLYYRRVSYHNLKFFLVLDVTNSLKWLTMNELEVILVWLLLTLMFIWLHVSICSIWMINNMTKQTTIYTHTSCMLCMFGSDFEWLTSLLSYLKSLWNTPLITQKWIHCLILHF